MKQVKRILSGIKTKLFMAVMMDGFMLGKKVDRYHGNFAY